MLDWLAIYANAKYQSSHDNRGAGKYVLGLLGIVIVGYLIIKAIVDVTGYDSLYSLVGGLILLGFKLFVALFVLGFVSLVGMAILRGLFGMVIAVDDFIRGTHRKGNNKDYYTN